MKCKECITYAVCRGLIINSLHETGHRLNLYGVYREVLLNKCDISYIKKLIQLLESDIKNGTKLSDVINEIENAFDVAVKYEYSEWGVCETKIYVKSV